MFFHNAPCGGDVHLSTTVCWSRRHAAMHIAFYTLYTDRIAVNSRCVNLCVRFAYALDAKHMTSIVATGLAYARAPLPHKQHRNESVVSVAYLLKCCIGSSGSVFASPSGLERIDCYVRTSPRSDCCCRISYGTSFSASDLHSHRFVPERGHHGSVAAAMWAALLSHPCSA